MKLHYTFTHLFYVFITCRCWMPQKTSCSGNDTQRREMYLMSQAAEPKCTLSSMHWLKVKDDSREAGNEIPGWNGRSMELGRKMTVHRPQQQTRNMRGPLVMKRWCFRGLRPNETSFSSLVATWRRNGNSFVVMAFWEFFECNYHEKSKIRVDVFLISSPTW